MASAMLSLLATGLFLGSATAATCSSYTVDTQGDTYQFNHYDFVDFRNQDSSFLGSDAFTSRYRPQSWASGKFQNLASNVAMTQDTVNGDSTSMLSLYARQQNGQTTAAELDSQASDYYYASVRMGVRVTGAPGACAGLFFYHSDTQETDIEILTREQNVHVDADTQQTAPATTSQIHLTNQPHLTKTVDISADDLLGALGGNSQVGTNASIGSWENFNTYRIDWIPGITKWWQNGALAHTADKNLIQNPSSWILNIWSNQDPTWSGTMAEGTEARMDILWVEMAYNKLAEGPPQVVAAGQQGCQLGVGDGTDLNNPTAATSTTTTSTTTSNNAPSTAPSTATSESDVATEQGTGSDATVIGTTKIPMRFAA